MCLTPGRGVLPSQANEHNWRKALTICIKTKITFEADPKPQVIIVFSPREKMKIWLIVAASLLLLADLCQDLDIGTMGEEKEMDGCVLHQENDFRLPGFDFSKLKVRDGGDWGENTFVKGALLWDGGGTRLSGGKPASNHL